MRVDAGDPLLSSLVATTGFVVIVVIMMFVELNLVEDSSQQLHVRPGEQLGGAFERFHTGGSCLYNQ